MCTRILLRCGRNALISCFSISVSFITLYGFFLSMLYLIMDFGSIEMNVSFPSFLQFPIVRFLVSQFAQSRTFFKQECRALFKSNKFHSQYRPMLCIGYSSFFFRLCFCYIQCFSSTRHMQTHTHMQPRIIYTSLGVYG